MPISAPVLLAADHELGPFESGVEMLDVWLKRRALGNQLSGASRTFVVTDGRRVTGYHALASGAISPLDAPGRFRRNMPDPVPVVVLGRLAVDRTWQGKGFGRGLLKDAALRVVNAADTIGIRGIVVHAISVEARAFYVALGFDGSPRDPMVLTLPLADIAALLS